MIQFLESINGGHIALGFIVFAIVCVLLVIRSPHL
jgi:hypothetical protein